MTRAALAAVAALALTGCGTPTEPDQPCFERAVVLAVPVVGAYLAPLVDCTPDR